MSRGLSSKNWGCVTLFWEPMEAEDVSADNIFMKHFSVIETPVARSRVYSVHNSGLGFFNTAFSRCVPPY